jgi:heptosyltransferase II
MKSVVVIRLGRLGDVTLTAPTMKNLRFLYPEADILLVTRRNYETLGGMIPGVSRVLTFPENGSYFDLMRLSGEIDQFHPDLIVDLHKNFRSFHLATLTRAPYKVVYHKRRKERQAAVSTKTFVSPVPHTTDLYNQTVKELKGEILARRPDLLLPSALTDGNGGIREGVAIVPGASSPVKAWPAERFAALAERIIYDFKCPVHIFLGDGEESLSAAFKAVPQDKISFHHNLPIDQVAAKLAHVRLTLTNDSGLMHVSSAVGTPTAAFFGPTHEQLGFYPLGLFDTVFAVSETCRPCSLHGNQPCYREEQYCFTRITVDMIYPRIAAILDRRLTPAVFIDRDGTLIEDRHYLADPQKIAFLDGALDGVSRLKEAGYKIIIISNQSGVARGFFPVETVDAVHQRLQHLMQEAGAAPDDIRFCPHYPDGDDPRYTCDCDCRKPKPGMVEDAAKEHGLDLKKSILIGDKFSDIQCGRVVGMESILVRTGEGARTEKELPANKYLRPDHICDHLGAAAAYILSRS